MSSEKEIQKKWGTYAFADKLKTILGEPVTLAENAIECMKKTSRSSIWKLELTGHNRSYPIILKIYNSPDKHKNQVELNIYQQAYKVLSGFMPQIYLTETGVNGKEIWVFMEYVQQLRGQIKMTPQRFDNIIPTVARLHAQTYEERFYRHNNLFRPWFPDYYSKNMINERMEQIKETRLYLAAALKRKNLKAIVEPYNNLLEAILKNGPDFFPELREAGQSIIHGDLHVQNISSNNISEDGEWDIRFIDWETAKFAPGWFDMAVLVEILMDFRKDWHSKEDDIRRHCVDVYASEMQKHGVTFKTDPLKLYKMAYLQRTLEKGLHTHLRRELEGRPGVLLPRYLEKVEVWGKELGLY